MTKCFECFFQCGGKREIKANASLRELLLERHSPKKITFHMVIHIRTSCQPGGGAFSPPPSTVQSQSFSRHYGTKSADSKQDEAPKNTGRQRRLNKKYPKWR